MRKLLFAALLASLSTLSHASGFKLSSPDFRPYHMIPTRFVYNGFGCHGDDISPALKWHGAPKGTKSYALTIYDPDAPTGSGWWHWMVINIPANVHSLPQNAGALNSTTLPAGAEQIHSDFGVAAFGGPCPPPGKPHHYVFTVYAIKTAKLKVPANATAALVGYMIHGNMLGEAHFVALYGRHK